MVPILNLNKKNWDSTNETANCDVVGFSDIVKILEAHWCVSSSWHPVWRTLIVDLVFCWMCLIAMQLKNILGFIIRFQHQCFNAMNFRTKKLRLYGNKAKKTNLCVNFASATPNSTTWNVSTSSLFIDDLAKNLTSWKELLKDVGEELLLSPCSLNLLRF